MEYEPSTSNAEIDVVLDDDFIRQCGRLPINKLKEHLALLEKDDHPLLHTERRRIHKDRAKHFERIECHRQRAEIRAKEDVEFRAKTYQEQTNTRTNELNEECVRRAEDLERVFENEYANLDINKAATVPITYEANKKTLRGRGGHLIEPLTYFNSNQNNRGHDMRLELGYSEAAIRESLDSINTRPDLRRKQKLAVSIQKPKLIIENKSFKHGEEVYAWNNTLGELFARLEIVSEKTIILKGNNQTEQTTLLRIVLKGANGWDSRQIIATLEDLEDSRVTITKQREKERGF
ncbi:unnamed protein product [Caenorhabditis brenneri]